jgi:membrane dipeptidase
MKKIFPIFDAHEDIAFHLSYFNRDFVYPHIPCMITLPGLKEANVRFILNTIFVHPKLRPENTIENANLQFKVYEDLYKKFNKDIIQVINLDDIKIAIKTNKIGFITLMEGADPLENADSVYGFHEKGLRVLGLTWNNKNKYASGPDSEDGISDMGYRLIENINKLKITLDLSHLNKNSFWQCLDKYDHIPIASHSNARSLTDHPRNLDDEQLKEISDRGGVVGIVLYNHFLKTGDHKPTLEDIYMHIDYILGLCGEEHIGIGSDLDGARISDFPRQIRTVSKLQKIPDYLIKKGYSTDLVRKITYDNFLSVISQNMNI